MFVICGEVLMDMVAQDNGQSLSAHIGGGPFNTGLALARLEQNVYFMHPISTDYYGTKIIEYMKANNIRYHCPYKSHLPTPLALSTIDDKGVAQYKFYCTGTAQKDIREAQIIANLTDNIEIIHTGTLAIAETKDANAIRNIVQGAKKKGALVSFDPNIRDNNFTDKKTYRNNVFKLIQCSNIIKLSDEDITFLYPSLSVQAAFDKLCNDHPQVALVVLTCGSKTVLCRHKNTTHTQVIPPIQVVDTIGAGDCFIAGFLFELKRLGIHNNQTLNMLTTDIIAQCLKTAITIAGLNCQQSGCNPPYLKDI